MAEISNKRKLLIVSLPRNDVELAKAAKDAGADMLKVHLNVTHFTSGTKFGNLREEGKKLEGILAVGLPVGLVPGQDEMIGREEIPLLRAMGFCFLDAYVFALRSYLYDAGLPVVPALYPDFAPALLPHLKALPGEWLEAAIVPQDGYGEDLMAEDLVRLDLVGHWSNRKLIVPSQRKLRPEDLCHLFRIPYIYAIMIGAVVTGSTIHQLSKTTADFRRSLDKLEIKS